MFCQIWAFFDWGLYITQTILFAWVTIERHILVALLLYCLILYTVVYFFPPCENVVDYFYVTGIAPCLFNDAIFSKFDTIVHEVLPAFVIVIFSIVLLLRILRQKYRMRQRIQWRKMAIQLLSISFLYFIFLVPFTLVDFMLVCGYPLEKLVDFRQYAMFLHFFMTLFFPFICILSLSELRLKFIKILHLLRQFRRIGPAKGPIRILVINHIRAQ